MLQKLSIVSDQFSDHWHNLLSSICICLLSPNRLKLKEAVRCAEGASFSKSGLSHIWVLTTDKSWENYFSHLLKKKRWIIYSKESWEGMKEIMCGKHSAYSRLSIMFWFTFHFPFIFSHSFLLLFNIAMFSLQVFIHSPNSKADPSG